MATIITRAGKGSPLTNAEVDANFTNINNELVNPEISVTASRNLLLTDIKKILACNSSSAITITVQPQATTAIPNDEIVTIFQEGTGASTFAAAGGVTIQGVAPTPTQFKHIAIRHRNGNIWVWV